jgi:hypothetical protein
MAGKMICHASEPLPDHKEEYMTYKSDEEIQIEALFQLDWDSRLKQSEIGVTVKVRRVRIGAGLVRLQVVAVRKNRAAHDTEPGPFL